MRYRGSEAQVLEAAPFEVSWQDDSLVAVEGGGLDAEARAGVASVVPRAALRVLAAVLALFMAGSVAISLASGTVSLMQANADVSAQITQVRAANDDLRIECSLLSRSERITRIATQNLGMEYASKAEVLVLD